MKKKITIATILALCAGLGVAGCRSRVTASSDADEIKNAEDALATTDEDTAVGQFIKNSMSNEEENDTETEEENKKEKEDKTEQETEQDQENETEDIPEVTTTPPESTEDDTDDGDTNDKEAIPTEDNNTDPGNEKKSDDDADKEYSKDDRNHGDDLIDPDSDNKTDKGSGNGTGNGEDGGQGGPGNGGKSPGISDNTPTEPPETPPAEEEKPSEEPTTSEPTPSEENPSEELPDIRVMVRFDAAEGDISDSSAREVKVGEQYGALPECSKGGYTFAGWFTGENGSGIRINGSSVVSIEEDHTLYAFYVQREIHNVHFVHEGVKGNYWIGNAADENRQVYVGDTYGSAFPVPKTRSGYTFLGWYDAPVGGNPVSNNDTFTANTDIELYAHMDYDPLPYWTGILNNVNGYPCQNLGTICEYDEPNVPVTNSLFIARLGRGPVQAADSSTAGMTTEEIIKAKPNTRVMIKIISDISNADAVASEVLGRYPVTYPYQNRALYIIPAEAESGYPAVTLVYNLAIKMELWPESFENNQALNPWGLDALNKAVEELGVPYPTIIHYGY